VRRPPKDSVLTPSARDAVAAALGQLGCAQIKWKSGAVQFETGGTKVELSETILPEWIRSIEPPVNTDKLVIALSDVPGLQVPRAIAADLSLVQSRLFRRVVARAAFSGPSRSMCRREVGTDLYAAIWIRLGGMGFWLTSAELDRWPIDFEEAFTVARANLADVIAVGSVNEISDGHGVFAALAEGADLCGGLLCMETFLPGDFAPGAHGALACSPSPGTILLLPVRPGAGAEGVASIVQISDMLRDDHSATETQKRLYWAQPTSAGSILRYALHMLPVVTIHEGSSRRAHIDSSDEVQTLLRVLGEID